MLYGLFIFALIWLVRVNDTNKPDRSDPAS
jgi:hypothetical protein